MRGCKDHTSRGDNEIQPHTLPSLREKLPFSFHSSQPHTHRLILIRITRQHMNSHPPLNPTTHPHTISPLNIHTTVSVQYRGHSFPSRPHTHTHLPYNFKADRALIHLHQVFWECVGQIGKRDTRRHRGSRATPTPTASIPEQEKGALDE